MSEKRNDEARPSERWRALHELEDWLDVPMAVLGLAWLVLLVLELTRGLSATLQTLSLIIWGIFLLDFALRLALAPDRPAYLKRNWLTALALAIPALRVARLLRVLRVVRFARGVRLIRLITSVNRGMLSLGRSLGRRGAGYVFALTVVVLIGGAAGMLSFERSVQGTGLENYGDALWWTAMIITTLGSEYWPRTPEGRILAVLLSFYALGVLGYITAALASVFVGRDAAADARHGREMAQLRQQLTSIEQQLGARDGAG